MSKPILRWALRWMAGRRHPIIQGHFMFENLQPLLFVTKKDAMTYAKKHFGYIVTRKDLRSAPYYWRLPRPVRVEVLITEASSK